MGQQVVLLVGGTAFLLLGLLILRKLKSQSHLQQNYLGKLMMVCFVGAAFFILGGLGVIHH